MLIWTARFSRKKAALAVIVLGLVSALVIVLAGRLPSDSPAEAVVLSDSAQRVAYLESLGWQVDPEPLETLQFLMPETLEEPYLSYNQLQLEQGFDLTECCGRQLSRYTYRVTNYPGRASGVQANLYVCEDVLAGGDIFCPGADGFQAPLAFPAQE